VKQILFSLFFVLILGTLPAQNIVFHSEWEDSLDKEVLRDRLIVEFKQGTPVASQQLILQLVGLQDAWRLPYPEVVIAKIPREVADYRELKTIIAALNQYNEVKLATPFIRSQGPNPVGILSTVAVEVDNEVAFQQLLAFAERNHLYPIYPDAYMKNIWWLTTNKYSGYNALEAAIMLNQCGLFGFAEPNYLLTPRTAAVVNDQFYSRQWNLQNDSTTSFVNGIIASPDADMDVDSAWSITTGESFIRVAVIDAGVDTLHPDLVGKLLPGYDATGGGSNGYPNLDKASNAHGTACSGIIAATADNGIGIAGVAHGCQIIPIKVFYYIDTVYSGIPLNDIPYSTSQWFANAINWAWRNAEADIMSNSWGLDDIYLQLLSGNPMLVEEAIIAAADSGRLGLGTPMLFSSGNANTEPIWPSRLPQTIAVNATSMCDERKNPASCDGENWTGCWGYGLEVSAPGVKITTCDISGNKGYTSGDYTFSFNGTSAACPNAAAVVALMLSVRPDLSLSAVRYVLGSTADRVGGYNYNQNYTAGTWSNELGYGRVNAYKAVIGAQEYTGHNETGIVDVANNKQMLQMYPNPMQGSQVTLSFDLPVSTKAQVNITGFDGRTVYQKDMGLLYDGANEHTITFDKTLAPGAYLVGLTTGNQTTYSRLVIINQQ